MRGKGNDESKHLNSITLVNDFISMYHQAWNTNWNFNNRQTTVFV